MCSRARGNSISCLVLVAYFPPSDSSHPGAVAHVFINLHVLSTSYTPSIRTFTWLLGPQSLLLASLQQLACHGLWLTSRLKTRVGRSLLTFLPQERICGTHAKSHAQYGVHVCTANDERSGSRTLHWHCRRSTEYHCFGSVRYVYVIIRPGQQASKAYVLRG
jgi:hypothetical protein